MTIVTLLKKNKMHSEKEDFSYNGPYPTVTIQIPTFNEIVALRCAKKCLEFDYPKDKYEIIIGDDSNDIKISKKIDQFAKQHPEIKVTRRGNNIGYKPANLNHMLKYSNGEILVIFDSDFMPTSDFLKRIVVPFMKDNLVAGVQARWKLMNSEQNMTSVLGTTIISTFHQISIPYVYDKRELCVLCGSAEAVRKSALIKLGGWEIGNLTEDIEFSLRLLKNGYKIKYLENLECDSEVPYTLKDLCRQQMRWAYGVIYSWKKHFKEMMTSTKLTFSDKFYMLTVFCTGYLLSVLLACLFITGILSLITHEPAPIEWGRFFYEMLRNIALTSGLLVAGVVALYKTKNKKLTLRMIGSSFSYGLVVTYYVNVGIFKALFRYPMQWFMLKKIGNKTLD